MRTAGLYLTIVCAAAAFALMALAPLAEKRAKLCRMVCLVGGLAGMPAGCLWGVRCGCPLETQWTAVGAAVLMSRLFGGMLIGSVTVAWMLGHAYLTASRMTIAPLRRLSRLLMAVVVARGAYVGVCLAVLWLTSGQAELRSPQRVWVLLMLFLRVGVGLVGLGVFAYMVLDCVRWRSTQSATGILYFASIFAYIGELSAQYLITEWGWPM